MEDEYFWFWHGDDGEWQLFDPAALAQLEAARKRGDDSVQLTGTPYLVNLAFLQQVNESTGRVRDIAMCEACWYWRDDDGETWKPYTPEESLKLALAALSPVGDHWTYLQHGESLYYVDIRRRRQSNTATDYEREIFQGVPPAVRNSVASVRNSAASNIVDGNNNGSFSAPSEPPQRTSAASVASVSPQRSSSTPNIPEDNNLHVVSDDEDDESETNTNDGDDLEGVPQNFVCPLSRRIMVDPVQTVVGSTYERRRIAKYLRKHSSDPVTGDFLPSKMLVDNRGLRDSIETWKETHAQKVHVKEETMQKQAPKPRVPPAIQYTTDYVQSSDVQDTLKVVLLGLSNFGTDVALRNPTTVDGKPGVNQYRWSLRSSNCHGVCCNVYDFVGQKVHHATQKLFFTSGAVYFVMWDLGAALGSEDTSLERDIFEKVQFWVDSIEQHAPGSVVVPVASLDAALQKQMEEEEIQRRCLALAEYFRDRPRVICDPTRPDPVLCVGGDPSDDKMTSIKNWMVEQAGGSELFPSLGQAIPPSYQLMRDVVNQMAEDGTHLVEVNELASFACSGDDCTELRGALQYLASTGQILYYDDMSTYAVLNPSWLVKAVASVLLPSLHDTIKSVRRKAADAADEIYHGPVATESDIQDLWRSKFVNDDDTMKPGIRTDSQPLFAWLHRLFTRVGILLPLTYVNGDFVNASSFVFLPALLSPGDHAEFVGIYKNTVFSKTSLAQSAQFHRMVSPTIMEQVTAAVLGQVYAKAVRGREEDVGEGQLYVKDLLCWRTLLYVKLGFKARTSSDDVQWSVVDIYVHLVDSFSPLCVGATFMGESTQSLILSAKGEEGNDGQVIWEGGYELVSQAIRQSLDYSGNELDFDRHYFCPTCLTRSNLREARSWSEFMLQIATGRRDEELICEAGHTIKTGLVLGPKSVAASGNHGQLMRSPSNVTPDVRACQVMPGIVMVGLYDEKRKSGKIRKVGSGFIFDRKRGLIVTAAHTLMKLWGKDNYGRDYDGIEGAKAVIGVVPDNYDTSQQTYPPAVFRYFATICSKDPGLDIGECHVDACVLQITSKFENDVDGNGDLCSDEISIRLSGKPALMEKEGLTQLTVTQDVHPGEPVRILGFDQPDRTRLNRTFGISAGRVHKQFETKSVGGERYRYMPRKKIVLNCPTIGGHSGGPCVNQKGEVIGILSCADFTEKSRCYLAPTSEWLSLIPPRENNALLAPRSVSTPLKVQSATLKPAPGSLMIAQSASP